VGSAFRYASEHVCVLDHLHRILTYHLLEELQTRLATVDLILLAILGLNKKLNFKPRQAQLCSPRKCPAAEA
jgi:hypothetical protein